MYACAGGAMLASASAASSRHGLCHRECRFVARRCAVHKPMVVTYHQVALAARHLLATGKGCPNRFRYRVLAGCAGKGAILAEELGRSRDGGAGDALGLLERLSLELD